jgi:putative ABC transport system permease protein
MRILATVVIALRALRRNKLRSFLTTLGIIIGVAGVIAMLAIGAGATAQVEAQVASLGRNVVTVFPGSGNSGGARGGWGSASTLTTNDLAAIEREVTGIAAIMPELRGRYQVLANGLNWNTEVRGVTPDILSIRAWPVAEGSFFAEPDIRGALKVCVIGGTVARQLFPDGQAVGQVLRIRNIPFRILGIMSNKGFNYFGRDEDDTVLIPHTTFNSRIERRQFLNNITMEAARSVDMARIQREVDDLLRQRRSGREPDYTVRNQLELAQTATATSRVMTILLGFIAGISLIVGGIGVMNIMLVSVTERTREIGIRLAIGAHDRDIRLQFLIEAVMLSLLGGLLGIALGVGAVQLITKTLAWPVLISTTSVLGAVGVSAAVGIGFGFYPAHKAAQLDPIEALRYE